ncbi:structural protein [Synechococcus phage Syn5]|uniref:Structural protein n=1 Tax=Synechococcus phage Syn5 TaxID=2914003 RepID=A4ZRD9_9CAUD|nr:structural protein [Synechococcus phage Syn5]ABP87965.1 structural protein [Synechococcus phage Syn5]
MSATTSNASASSQPRKLYSLLSRGAGERVLDATAVAAIKALNESTEGAADGPTTATTVNAILDIVEACEARNRVVTDTAIGGATQNLTAQASGVGSFSDLTTSVASFTASQTGLSVTIAGAATGTADTDADGNITALTITSAGSGYRLGDVVSVSEGAGRAAFIVRTLA